MQRRPGAERGAHPPAPVDCAPRPRPRPHSVAVDARCRGAVAATTRGAVALEEAELLC